MAFKSLLLLFVALVVAVGTAPAAEAQAVSGISVAGTVLCSLSSSTGVVFANATVNLKCGAGNVISAATTNSNGQFTISVNSSLLPITNLQSLLTNCSLVVNTPLSTCNPTLPASGFLVSPLQFVGNTVQGSGIIANLVAVAFGFLPSI